MSRRSRTEQQLCKAVKGRASCVSGKCRRGTHRGCIGLRTRHGGARPRLVACAIARPLASGSPRDAGACEERPRGAAERATRQRSNSGPTMRSSTYGTSILRPRADKGRRVPTKADKGQRAPRWRVDTLRFRALKGDASTRRRPGLSRGSAVSSQQDHVVVGSFSTVFRMFGRHSSRIHDSCHEPARPRPRATSMSTSPRPLATWHCARTPKIR
ncbi:hypothetical protein M885DRAFT_107881 [Pelagophyceae sp. CCMP2097]|nr:hypothetical protein M885DRAFT_107881 [Pelagophyceae sp. CCMP2097]